MHVYSPTPLNYYFTIVLNAEHFIAQLLSQLCTPTHEIGHIVSPVGPVNRDARVVGDGRIFVSQYEVGQRPWFNLVITVTAEFDVVHIATS